MSLCESDAPVEMIAALYAANGRWKRCFKEYSQRRHLDHDLENYK